jgi:hypothetical protein
VQTMVFAPAGSAGRTCASAFATASTHDLARATVATES